MSQIRSSPAHTRQYKSSRPFLSFLKPARPAISYGCPSPPKPDLSGPGPLPPPNGPLPPIPDRPTTSCSILADAEAAGSPEKQYPAVTFASPVSRRHSRNASTPIARPPKTPPTARARAGTVQIATSTPLADSSAEFKTNSAGLPNVIVRDYAQMENRSSPDSFRHPPDRVAPADVLGTPKGTPPRKRPSALRLQTTNLGPPLPILSPATPTPAPSRAHGGRDTGLTSKASGQSKKHQGLVALDIETDRGERRRSRSTGDLQQSIVENAHAAHQHHRVSRSESAMQLNQRLVSQDPDAHEGSLTFTPRTDVYTPASTLSCISVATPGSDDTVSPARTTLGGRFENVPLPWSTHPLSQLEPSLPAHYLPEALSHLLHTTPYLLTPETFDSLSSEQARLGLELDRLRVKHAKISQYRDKLLVRTQTVGDLRAARLGALQDAVNRVDRVARQIFICNDQIRQMEVMKRDHEVGVLLWAMERSASPGHNSAPSAVECATDWQDDTAVIDFENADSPSSVAKSEVDTSETLIPDIQLTRATIYAKDQERAPTLTGEEDACEYLISPSDERQDDQSLPDSRPVSTISLSLSPINLGFPLPPSRPTLWPSAEVHSCFSAPDPTLLPTGHDSLEVDVTGDVDAESQLTPTTTSHQHHDHEHHRILIYPPSQHLGTSVALSKGNDTTLDMPHTPLRSEDNHDSATHSTGRDLPPLPPLRTRRSKPNMTIVVPSPIGQSSRTFRQVITRREGEGPTSPLRLTAKARPRSYSLNLREGFISRRRDRESNVESSESILLSLATAELWTREAVTVNTGHARYVDV